MDCTTAREHVSADLDGELGPEDHQALAQHLDGCASCHAFAEQAGSLHRSFRVRTADRVPDLVPAVMARAKVSTRPSLVAFGARWALGLLGVIQVVIGIAAFVGARTIGPGYHVHNHVSGCTIAFGIGLVVAAVLPDRARGLLPLAAALVLTTMLDLTDGSVATRVEAPYVIEFVGIALLVAVSRTRAGFGRPGGPSTGLRIPLRPTPSL